MPSEFIGYFSGRTAPVLFCHLFNDILLGNLSAAKFSKPWIHIVIKMNQRPNKSPPHRSRNNTPYKLLMAQRLRPSQKLRFRWDKRCSFDYLSKQVSRELGYKPAKDILFNDIILFCVHGYPIWHICRFKKSWFRNQQFDNLRFPKTKYPNYNAKLALKWKKLNHRKPLKNWITETPGEKVSSCVDLTKFFNNLR